ncbi:MAG: aminodeoxychorismate/anthranilate synthase component II [Parvularculaceae bacterium]
MILMIDNYDSFTWNLVQLIGGLGRPVEVVRNDALTVAEALSHGAEAIVISPGPGMPKDAGICVELVRRATDTRTPVFGVCLGLQSIAEAFGGEIGRAPRLMHGKTSAIRHQGGPLFKGLPDPFTATRYHSLIAKRDKLPNSLKIAATSDDDGEIMALECETAPIAGVQFHPESIASEYGAEIFSNFLVWAQKKKAQA